MNFSRNKIIASAWCVCFLLLATAGTAYAQQAPDTANTVEVIIENAGHLEQNRVDSATIIRFTRDVRMRQGGTIMTCDTVFINQETNNLEAFGNVNITQTDGTNVTSDYLKYTGNTKQAYLRGNVRLTDGKNTLWGDELDYNLGTKIGNYTKGGTLQADQTTLSSNTGTYNVNTKDARFKGDVYVTDPQYTVTSADLGYNTESKMVRFYGASTVTSDRSVLKTTSGTWDGKNEIAHFTDRSSVLNADQYIEADALDYNKQTGFGIAKGNVYALDTAMKTTLFAGYARYNEKTREMWATLKPVMKKATESDSIYMRADTFYVAPVPRAADSSARIKDTIAKAKDTLTKTIGKGIKERSIVPAADTSVADSAVTRYFIGYHHVLVFSDSLQAVCDSISYSQADSTMRMMKNPVAWSRNGQMTGDTVLILLANNKIDKLFIPNNAFMVSRSGPERANLYDQVQGRTMTGYFDSGALKQMVVFPSAEAIYYAIDEEGAYLGANQATSERMRVFLDSGKIGRIVLEQEVKQTMTPMQQVNIPTMRLGRFNWQPEKRPKSVGDLFLYEPEGYRKESGEEKESEGESGREKDGASGKEGGKPAATKKPGKKSRKK